jgi:hypothetical protein
MKPALVAAAVLVLLVVVIIFVLARRKSVPAPGGATCALDTNGVLRTADNRLCATTTRYWDCSRPTCSWHPCGADNCAACSGAPDGVHASPANQPLVQDGVVYVTAAASGSFGINPDSGGPACGECYELEVTGQCGNPYACGQYACDNQKNAGMSGQKFVVMVTNDCPDWQPGGSCCSGSGSCGGGCPPTPQDHNLRGAAHHFDLAIPGGGFGAQGKCSSAYTWSPRSAGDCAKPDIIPPAYQAGCEAYFNQLGGMDNPMVAFRKISCPAGVASYDALNCSSTGRASGNGSLHY